MALRAAPSVSIQEESIPSATAFQASGRGVSAIQSNLGLPGEFLFISNEDDLLNTIGAPKTDKESQDFYTAQSFLSYGNDLVLVRAIDPATAKDQRIGFNYSVTGDIDTLQGISDKKFFANESEVDAHTIKPGLDLEFYAKEPFDDSYRQLSVAISKFEVRTGVSTWHENTDTIDGSTTFSSQFEYGPNVDRKEIALVVLVDGVITEKFIVSVVEGFKLDTGENSYITEILKNKSAYINGFSSNSASTYDNVKSVTETNLLDGSKGSDPTDSHFETAFSKFISKNDIAFDYIYAGTHYANRGFIIDNIAEVRHDCVAYVAPPQSQIVGITSSDTIVSNLVTDIQTLTRSTWSSYNGNWKQTKDKYRDKFVWIPIDSDIVGNKVRVNTESEVWTPAAGNLNGQIKNVQKLAFNPSETQQDTLYKNGINHVIFRPNKGFIVDGQKTMTTRNIGTSRVNVRDLFRVIEIYVASVAQDFVHQPNTETTRLRLVNIINPFLEDIKKRQGIFDFKVVDNTTSLDIDSYIIDLSVLIKPTRAAEFIKIKFYDVPNGVSFDEIV